MTSDRTVSERSESAAANHFRLVGELVATVESHKERLTEAEKSLRTYDARTRDMQSQLSNLAKITEGILLAIGRVEDGREKDNKALQDALIEALERAPRSNRAGANIGLIVAAMALALVVYLLAVGRLG